MMGRVSRFATPSAVVVAFGGGALFRYALRLRRPSSRATLESADREAAGAVGMQLFFGG